MLDKCTRWLNYYKNEVSTPKDYCNILDRLVILSLIKVESKVIKKINSNGEIEWLLFLKVTHITTNNFIIMF